MEVHGCRVQFLGRQRVEVGSGGDSKGRRADESRFASPANAPPRTPQKTVKGVGEVTAKRLMEALGERLFEVLDAPSAEAELAAIPGIGKKAAERIKRSWDEQAGRRRYILFLTQLGLPLAVANKARRAARRGAASSACSERQRRRYTAACRPSCRARRPSLEALF